MGDGRKCCYDEREDDKVPNPELQRQDKSYGTDRGPDGRRGHVVPHFPQLPPYIRDQKGDQNDQK